MFLRVLVTATPLSARVDSDVVEEEDSAKRSGRVRPPNRLKAEGDSKPC